MKTSQIQSGFTIITLIIIGASALVLLVAALSGLRAGRVKARDAARLADVTAISKALKTYYEYNQKYPPAVSGVPDGITSYLSFWPIAPKADGECTDAQNAYTYTQTSGGESYRLGFCLNSSTGGYSPGYNQILP